MKVNGTMGDYQFGMDQLLMMAMANINSNNCNNGLSLSALSPPSSTSSSSSPLPGFDLAALLQLQLQQQQSFSDCGVATQDALTNAAAAVAYLAELQNRRMVTAALLSPWANLDLRLLNPLAGSTTATGIPNVRAEEVNMKPQDFPEPEDEVIPSDAQAQMGRSSNLSLSSLSSLSSSSTAASFPSMFSFCSGLDTSSPRELERKRSFPCFATGNNNRFTNGGGFNSDNSCDDGMSELKKPRVSASFFRNSSQEEVYMECPPAHQRVKGCVYMVRGHLKKWDGRRFARCCEHPSCFKLAQGPTNYCKAHGGGQRCKEQGCKRAARGGSERCSSHGGGKRCQEPGCSKAAVSIDFCRRHSKLKAATSRSSSESEDDSSVSYKLEEQTRTVFNKTAPRESTI